MAQQADDPRRGSHHALLSELMLIPGLSGFEGRVRGYIAIRTRQTRSGVARPTGSAISSRRSTATKTRRRVMLFAHMDQLGLIVRKIEAYGLIRVERARRRAREGAAVQEVLLCVCTAAGRPGVIANKSHHATLPEEKYRVVPYPDLYVDAGFRERRRSARGWRRYRHSGRLRPKAIELAGGRIAGTAVDDRAGCAVHRRSGARALKQAAHAADHASRVLGPGGIQFARRGHGGASAQPDIAIQLDLMLATDTPDMAVARRGAPRRRAGHEPLQLPWPRHAQWHHPPSGIGRLFEETAAHEETSAAAQRPYRRS